MSSDHSIKDNIGVSPAERTWSCPDCETELSVADCCTQDDEWLLVCRDCKLIFTVEELVEMALDRIGAEAKVPEKSQIELLANYIMAEVPGEPSQSEGAGDCAIRLLKNYKVLLDTVNAYRMAHSAAEATGSHMVDHTGNVSDTYAAMLVAADQFAVEQA